MWRGRRDTEAQDDVDVQIEACAAVTVGRPSKAEQYGLARGWPRWLRGSLLAAILVGFPVSNILLFISINRMPVEEMETGHQLMENMPNQHVVENSASARNRVHAGSLQSGSRGDSSKPWHAWEEFSSQVAKDGLFNRYHHYFNSESRALQKYGRVLVVSHAFLGPVDASGPATAMTSLSELLNDNGFDVTMLYTGETKALQRGNWELWQSYWSNRGLQLVALPDSPISYDVSQENAISHRVYLWLKEAENYDIVHFSDIDGVGYWSVKAKYQGLAFKRMAMVVHIHAPHLWRKVGGLEALDSVRDLMVDYMQQESVKHADLVVAPSQFVLDWASINGWGAMKDKARVFQSPNLLPAWVLRRARDAEDEMPFREVVFFSQLELRKGLVLFCDVLDRIERLNPALLKGIQVTFLGDPPVNQTLPLPDNRHATTNEYITFRGRKWRSFSWTITTNMDSQERVDYMIAGSRLAVFPMIAENSPYAIQECIVAAIPFLATDVGGVAELLTPADRERLLVEPTPKAITNRLSEALRSGLKPAHPPTAPDFAQQSLRETWVVWHHIVLHHMQALAMDASTQLQRHPLVTVCIVHFNNPALLKQAIESLENGDYQNFQIVVVDDGSTDPEAQQYLDELDVYFQAKGWKIGQQESRGPGAGRNLAASLASPHTEYYMFMDDDNIAKPHELLTFLSVAMHTGAQVLTCVNDYFFGNDSPSSSTQPIGRWVPLGAAQEVGIFQNMYGDTNAMLHRDVFQAVGGFPEDFGYALEDWELFSKCVLAGYHLESVPDPLYWYRLRDTSHSRVTATHSNNMRSIRPYLKTIPQDMHHLVLFAQGMKSSHDMSQKELKEEEGKNTELQNMVKALASSIHSMCEDGKLAATSKNRLLNADFQQTTSEDAYPASGWKPFERGYTIDKQGGRVEVLTGEGAPAYGNQAIRMTNSDWRQSSGATRQVILNQSRPGAVLVSGWSKAEKVSGHPDGGYALYVDVVYQDGSKLWGHEIPFDVGTHGWQYKASVLDPDIPIEWLQVYAMFRWHSGMAWFDDLAVTLLQEGLCEYSQLALEGIAGEA